MKTLGLLGGMSWESTAIYYRLLNEMVRERLGVAPEKVPSNIVNYGNTSAATIPILVDEMRRDERLRPGQLVCFLALGAGLHWGAAVMRL